ncbi:MAG: hypothetical protein ABUS79_05390 [Pseudomonadota bacterium]
MIAATAFTVILIVAGVAATGWGTATALRAPRPASLGGAAVGAIGLALVLAGATGVVVPGFLF